MRLVSTPKAHQWAVEWQHDTSDSITGLRTSSTAALDRSGRHGEDPPSRSKPPLVPGDNRGHCKLQCTAPLLGPPARRYAPDRKSTRLNSSHRTISYAVFCLKKKKKKSLNYSDK